MNKDTREPLPHMTCVKLKLTNHYKESFYFAELGDAWPRDPSKFMVKRTTSNPDEAMCFDSVPEAVAMILRTGNDQWTVDVTDTVTQKKP